MEPSDLAKGSIAPPKTYHRTLSKPELQTQGSQIKGQRMAEQSTALSSKVMNMAQCPTSSVSQLLHQPSNTSLVKTNAWLSERNMQGAQTGGLRVMKDLAPILPRQSTQTDVGRLPRRSMVDVTFGKYDTYLDENPRNSSFMGSPDSPEKASEGAYAGNAVAKLPDSSCQNSASKEGQQFSDAPAVPLLIAPKPKGDSRSGKSGISLKAAQLGVKFSLAAEHAAKDAKSNALSRANARGSFSAIQDETKQLLDRMKRDSSMQGVKLLLSSDKPTQELIDLAFDERKLAQVLKKLKSEEQRKQKRLLRQEEWDQQQQRKRRLGSQFSINRRSYPHQTSPNASDSGKTSAGRRKLADVGRGESSEGLRVTESAAHARVVEDAEDDESLAIWRGREQTRSGHARASKEEFMAKLEALPEQGRNVLVVSRLAQAMQDLHQRQRTWEQMLQWMNLYDCWDPDSLVINAWTVLYVLLILYIATWGIFNTAFPADEEAGFSRRQAASTAEAGLSCDVAFSPQQWFDAAVDLFFILDILLRLFAFGYVEEESKRTGSSIAVTVTLPNMVLVTYARKGLVIDLITAPPIAWISMALEASCSGNTSGLLLARGLRIFRVTRVVKLFRTYKVRMWVRRLKRVTGNTSITQVMNLVLLLGFLNHIWTCISWVVQSLDEQGFEDWKAEQGIRDGADRYDEYSLTFMSTLQALFAIESYSADTKFEAWFGSVTLALAVFISATMLSKILEIWQMANETQTQRDSRINTVMQFTSRNGISTNLRDEVLDYFEFRYSNPSSDFERFFLDDLPSEMQTRMISQMFPDALEKSALFKAAPEMFVSHLIVKMAHRPMPTMPNQIILKQGAFNSEMFLIKSGSVEVTVENEDGQTRRIKLLEQGSTFGDLSMWMDSRQAATVTSVEFCQLHKLDRHDLEEALLAFPEMANIIASQALAYCLSNSAMCMALEGIGAAAADRIGRRMARNRVEIDPGMALYAEGEEPHGAFVVRKGRVAVELLGERLESMQDARCVGFEALFTGRLYQETVRATTPVVAYWVSTEDMIELFANDLLLLERIESVADRWYRVERSHRLCLRWATFAEDLVEARPSETVAVDGISGPESQWRFLRALDSGSSAAEARGFSLLSSPLPVRGLGLGTELQEAGGQGEASTPSGHARGPQKGRRKSVSSLGGRGRRKSVSELAHMGHHQTPPSIAASLPHGGPTPPSQTEHRRPWGSLSASAAAAVEEEEEEEEEARGAEQRGPALFDPAPATRLAAFSPPSLPSPPSPRPWPRGASRERGAEEGGQGEQAGGAITRALSTGSEPSHHAAPASINSTLPSYIEGRAAANGGEEARRVSSSPSTPRLPGAAFSRETYR